MRFGRRRQIRFTDKSHPLMGIVSVIIGMISWISLIALCVVSYTSGGASGILAGVFGILVMVAAVFGFVFAVKCYKKEDIYLATPAAGSLLNGLMILICLILYVIGAA